MDLNIKRRKTVDLSAIRTWIVDKRNELAEYNLHTPGLESLQHELDHYGGYNHRSWMVFISMSCWRDIVDALQAYDDKNETNHYFGMLDCLERNAKNARFYYGGSERFKATGKEFVRVSRIYRRYLRVLGLTP